ncbi:HobA family DNA replication regulator [Sulfurospirillum sp. 1612]|uniref:HobA family DNA replication regulator n=1 Tax=Sulfurospirillum sp. 1612 TaxID=3094835 RepID=UPI002F958A53
MQKFLKWSLENIRKDSSMMSWMEEKRFEWVPLNVSMLKNLLAGHTILIVTDDDREWFGQYVLSDVNRLTKNRPILPFVSLKALFPNLNTLKTKEDIELLENMLMQSFPNGYTYFYVGKNNNIKMQIAKRKDDSFIWVMDEQLQNSFFLSSSDENLDIKLIQLYKLLDKSINALLFAEVDFDSE